MYLSEFGKCTEGALCGFVRWKAEECRAGRGSPTVSSRSVPSLWTLWLEHETLTPVFTAKLQFSTSQNVLTNTCNISPETWNSLRKELDMRDQQNNTSSLVAVPSNAPMNAQNVPMWLIILGIANRCPPYSKNPRCQGISPHMPSWSLWPWKISDSVYYPLIHGFNTLIVYFSREPRE